MKLDLFIHNLKVILKKNPGYKNLDVIYSVDDEGNEYKKVIFSPTLAQSHDLNFDYVELVGLLSDKNIDKKDVNTICIN